MTRESEARARGPHLPRQPPAPSAPLAVAPGTAPRRTCHERYLSGFVELLLQPGHRHGAGGRADAGGFRKCWQEAAAERAGRAEPPLVVAPPGLWARGRERRGTRARAERHPDVRGG